MLASTHNARGSTLAERSGQSLPLLIVDDDPDIVRMLKTVLVRQHEVITAGDGNEAFDLLQKHTVAAVLADHMMPGLTGVELLNKAFDLQPAAARVLITASDRANVVKDAVNLAHVHRFVSKPLRIADLSDVVSGAIHEANLETENARLVAELSHRNAQLENAIAMVQEQRERLEVEVAARTKELRDAVAELERLALRDGLTGLFNHRYFQEAVDAEIARAERHGHKVSLLFIDVDHFKNYNDRLGHPAGDRLLMRLSDLLVGRGNSYGRSKRVSDIAARYGGEEFVLVLPETDKQGAIVTADRVRRTIANYEFENRDVQPRGYVSASIGVACFPEDGATKPLLIEAADRALYRAKRLGRDRVCVAGMPDEPDAAGNV